jgi:hypothetical protein
MNLGVVKILSSNPNSSADTAAARLDSGSNTNSVSSGESPSSSAAKPEHTSAGASPPAAATASAVAAVAAVVASGVHSASAAYERLAELQDEPVQVIKSAPLAPCSSAQREGKSSSANDSSDGSAEHNRAALMAAAEVVAVAEVVVAAAECDSADTPISKSGIVAVPLATESTIGAPSAILLSRSTVKVCTLTAIHLYTATAYHIVCVHVQLASEPATQS